MDGRAIMKAASLQAAGSSVISVDRVALYHGRVTFDLVAVCMVAACSSIIFGYDTGIIGGILSRDDFLSQFFSVDPATAVADTGSAYCEYADQLVQFYTALFFLAGMIGSWVGCELSRRRGRRLAMFVASCCFLLGLGLSTGAANSAMLFVGRAILGFGVGLADQAVPVYLAEVPPPKMRGTLASMFGLGASSGILLGNLVNYGVQDVNEGWRITFAVGLVPSLVLFLGSVFLPDSPHSLIERGQPEAARRVLERFRGTADVDMEYADIAVAAEEEASVAQPWRNLFSAQYRGELWTVLLFAMFTQFTGLEAQVYYAPQVFTLAGLGGSQALGFTAIIGAMFVLAAIINMVLMDRVGRRALLICGTLIMIGMQTAMAALQGVYIPTTGPVDVPKAAGAGMVTVLVLFVLAWGFSWGPCSWVVPAEIQSLPTRVSGAALNVIVQFGSNFILTESFLAMLCSWKWGTYVFFAVMNVIALAYIFFLLPETQGVPVDKMHFLFEKHRFWRRVQPTGAIEGGNGDVEPGDTALNGPLDGLHPEPATVGGEVDIKTADQ